MNDNSAEKILQNFKIACEKFPKDIKYRKILAKHLGLDENQYFLLRPIIGEQEFTEILKSLEEKNFMPGNRLDSTKIDSHDDAYLKSGDFKANLHIHTKYSDGIMNEDEFLAQAVELANKNFELTPSPMPLLLSVTDHDTLEGTQNIIKKIAQNPTLYKNLRFVAGIEFSAITNKLKHLKKALLIHTHMYCLNPFDDTICNLIREKQKLKIELAHKTIKILNEELADILSKLETSFSITEEAEIHPMILKGEDEIEIPTKKYTCAKLNYHTYVTNNKKMLLILRENGISTQNLSIASSFNNYKSIIKLPGRLSDNYKKALQKYLEDKILEKTSRTIDLTDIFKSPHPETEAAIDKAFKICQNAHPSTDFIGDEFYSFEDLLETLSLKEFGVFNIAHPARTIVKDADTTVEALFDNMFGTFKDCAKAKALSYEGFYQSYSGTTYQEYLSAIKKAGKKYALLQTGGLDSHGPKITNRHPFP